MEYLLGNIIYLQKQQPEVLYEIDVLKILQNSQENTFAGFCFFSGLRPATLSKKDSNTGVSCELYEIFKNT